jgi:polyphosphate kinase 2
MSKKKQSKKALKQSEKKQSTLEKVIESQFVPEEQEPVKLTKKLYNHELERLQTELVRLQQWVQASGARLVVVFEGRDGAGKSSTIKRITDHLNSRVVHVASLPTPTDRDKTRWYFQRYIEQLPAAGEIVLFDRSWYNRAGVERVMGFCTDEEYERFLVQCPIFEKLLIDDGIMLRKYWFDVSNEEQEKRFDARISDTMKLWKFSPIDIASISHWEDYAKAADIMFARTGTAQSPWYRVDSNNKKRARINMIAHLLSTVPYKDVKEPVVKLPDYPKAKGYEIPGDSPVDPAVEEVPDVLATLLAGKSR